MLNGRFSFGDVTGDVTNRRPVGVFQRFESNLVLLRGVGFFGAFWSEKSVNALWESFSLWCVFLLLFFALNIVGFAGSLTGSFDAGRGVDLRDVRRLEACRRDHFSVTILWTVVHSKWRSLVGRLCFVVCVHFLRRPKRAQMGDGYV